MKWDLGKSFAWPFYYGSGALSFVQNCSELDEDVKGLPIDETQLV